MNGWVVAGVITGVVIGATVALGVHVVRSVKRVINAMPCREANCVGGWTEVHDDDRMYLVMHDCHPGYWPGVRSNGIRTK